MTNSFSIFKYILDIILKNNYLVFIVLYITCIIIIINIIIALFIVFLLKDFCLQEKINW